MFSGADVAGKVGHTSGFPPHLRLFLWVVTCLFIFPFFFLFNGSLFCHLGSLLCGSLINVCRLLFSF